MRSDYTRKLFFGLTLLGLRYAGWQLVKLPPEVEAEGCNCQEDGDCASQICFKYQCGDWGRCAISC